MNEANREIMKERQRIILRSAGGKMTAKEFCNEHVRRGWAYADLTPDRIGLEDTDIVRLTNPLQNVH
ncbi:MAG: hypothetical protein V3W41_22565 [Planctomycetota bacterium]